MRVYWTEPEDFLTRQAPLLPQAEYRKRVRLKRLIRRHQIPVENTAPNSLLFRLARLCVGVRP